MRFLVLLFLAFLCVEGNVRHVQRAISSLSNPTQPVQIQVPKGVIVPKKNSLAQPFQAATAVNGVIGEKRTGGHSVIGEKRGKHDEPKPSNENVGPKPKLNLNVATNPLVNKLTSIGKNGNNPSNPSNGNNPPPKPNVLAGTLFTKQQIHGGSAGKGNENPIPRANENMPPKPKGNMGLFTAANVKNNLANGGNNLVGPKPSKLGTSLRPINANQLKQTGLKGLGFIEAETDLDAEVEAEEASLLMEVEAAVDEDAEFEDW